VLLTIVPKDDPLVAEVRIRHEDIGFIEIGQTVKLKLAAYPFQKYGLLEGTVRTIAPDVSAARHKIRDRPHRPTSVSRRSCHLIASS
jgi:multidrug efflux pump subunit AcrA (membrane-fusion protein)